MQIVDRVPIPSLAIPIMRYRFKRGEVDSGYDLFSQIPEHDFDRETAHFALRHISRQVKISLSPIVVF